MRLSWNEIRTRAATFADEWRDAAYELERQDTAGVPVISSLPVDRPPPDDMAGVGAKVGRPSF